MHRIGQKRRSNFSLLVCLGTAMFLLPALASAQQSPSDKLDAFAKCLTQRNATMYGSFVCSHCDDQRKMFGDSFKYVNYVECSQMGLPQDAHACQSAEIRFTPTWILDNREKLVGVQTFKQLSDKTGCPLP